MRLETPALPAQANALLQRVLFEERVAAEELATLYEAYARVFPPSKRPTLDAIEARLKQDGAHTHLTAQRVLQVWKHMHNATLEETS